SIGTVDHEGRVSAQTRVADVLHHADDRRRRSSDEYLPPERIAAREVASSDAFADDDAPGRTLVIIELEIAPRQHRYPHRLEYARTHEVVVDGRRVLGIRRTAGHGNPRGHRQFAAERRVHRHADR